MSLNQAGETSEPHIISGKRIFANVTLFTMLGLGFMYQQTTELIKIRHPEIVQPTSSDSQVETEITAEEPVTKEPDEEVKIAKAIRSYRSSLSENDITALAGIVREESRKYKYDWELILAIMRTESHFNPRARSHKGARGLMQVLPSTAEWLAPKMGLKYTGRDSLYDPGYNVKLGTRYLHMLNQRFGNMEKAIAAYNRGPDGLTRYLRQGREFPSAYLVRVMDFYKELKDGADEYTS